MFNDPRLEVAITATTDDFNKALKDANKSLDDFSDKAAASSSKAKTHWEGLQDSVLGIHSAWLQVAGVVAAGAWLVDGAKQALEGEKAMNKLRIQIQNLGLDYSLLKDHVEGAIDATSRYALVQDDDVAAVLQQLIFLTGDYAGSVNNLNLVFDLAYQRGLSHAEASTIVGKAMEGNLAALGKLIPEFKNLDDEIDKNASQAERAAKTMELLRGKVTGAVGEMTEHERKVQEVTLAYTQLKESIGGVAVEIAHMLVMMSEKNLKAPLEWLGSVTGAIDAGAASLNPNAGPGEDNTRHPFSMGYLPGAPGKGRNNSRKGGGATSTTIAEQDYATADLVWTSEGFQPVQPSLSLPASNFDLGIAGGGGAAGFMDFAMNADFMVQQVEEAMMQAAEDERVLKAKAALKSLGPGPGMEEPQDEFSQAWLGYEQQIAALEQYNAKKHELIVQSSTTEEELHAGLAKMEMETVEKKRAFQIQAASSAFGASANFLQNLTVLTGKEGGKAFKLMKGFAIGQAIMDTYGAFTKALNSVPYPFNLAAAASVLVAGMARVKQISSTEPGGTASGTTISAGGTANPPYSGGSPNAYPVPTRTEEKAPISVTLVVNTLDGKDVNWTRVMEDNMIPALEKISGDGNRPINIRVQQT